MNKNMADIQNSQDYREMRLDKVGVKGIKYPIWVDDRKHHIQQTIANINMYVELPHHYRGTHMSRFIAILNHYQDKTIVNKLPELLAEMKTKLNADFAYIEIYFPYFIGKKAPVSKKSSLMSYDCCFIAELGKKFKLKISVAVPITALCPCSKEISKYGAHNQRGYVTVTFCYNEFVWIEEIIELVESQASAPVYALLKREDEKFVTELAYDNPKFVEDVVRDVANLLDKDKRITEYKVESEHFESIHNHNVYAMVKKHRKRNA